VFHVELLHRGARVTVDVHNCSPISAIYFTLQMELASTCLDEASDCVGRDVQFQGPLEKLGHKFS